MSDGHSGMSCEDAEAKIEELRAMLRSHGWHHARCAQRINGTRMCDCGYTDAIRIPATTGS